MPRLIPLALLALGCSIAPCAQSANCDLPPSEPSLTLNVGPFPFTALPSRDGCWVYVALLGKSDGAPGGIAVLRREGAQLTPQRIIPLEDDATGIVLTHDGKLLIAPSTDSIYFLDVDRINNGTPGPLLGQMHNDPASPRVGNIYANVTDDDKFLFVSEERAKAITVIDLSRARMEGFRPKAILGRIPVGRAPIALTFSADRRLLYTTSEVAPAEWGWPKACPKEGGNSPELVNPEGAVIVVDVARAATDPAHAVLSRVPAGCSPVRLVMSPQGDRIYVTARNSDAVLSFDTSKLVSDPAHALLAKVPVGPAPVPLAVFDHGRKILAGNSDRFAGPFKPQKLTLIDAAKMSEGSAAVLGTIQAGGFPREMRVSANERTLYLTNAGSGTVQLFDLERLPVAKP